MTRKHTAIIIGASAVLAAVIVFIFVFAVSQKMTNEYNHVYKEYDFDNEKLIEFIYEVNGFSVADKPYTITVKNDGTFIKKAEIGKNDIGIFGDDVPTITKQLTNEQLETLKNEIISADIKEFLRDNRSLYENGRYDGSAIIIYADNTQYTVFEESFYKQQSGKIQSLYDYLLSFITDEDNENYSEQIREYYNLSN